MNWDVEISYSGVLLSGVTVFSTIEALMLVVEHGGPTMLNSSCGGCAVDTGDWAKHYRATQIVTLGGRSIYDLHDLHELQLDPRSCGIDVVVSGHSHRPRVETIDGVLYLNPGSAGPRRFNLPITLATLELSAGCCRPDIHRLDEVR